MGAFSVSARDPSWDRAGIQAGQKGTQPQLEKRFASLIWRFRRSKDPATLSVLAEGSGEHYTVQLQVPVPGSE